MINGVNLIPMDRQRARARRQRMRVWLAVGSAWIVLLVGACIGTHLSTVQASDGGKRLTDAQLRVADLTARVAELRKSLVQAESLRQTAVSLGDQPDWSILLSLLSDLVEKDIVLREIVLRPAAAQPAAFQLDLRGYSRTQASVAEFVLRLQRLGLIGNVKLQRTGREPLYDTSAVSFEISGDISSTTGGN